MTIYLKHEFRTRKILKFYFKVCINLLLFVMSNTLTADLTIKTENAKP